MDPYRCYYCNATKTTERDALSHSREHHPKLELKYKKYELSPSTGKYGFRTLNYKVIPSELEKSGRKICIEANGIIISRPVVLRSPLTASSLHKKIKKENESDIKAKVKLFQNDENLSKQLPQEIANDSVDTTVVWDDADADDEDEDFSVMANMLPDVIKILKENNQLDVFMRFFELVKNDKFPPNQIAYLLFLDVIRLLASNDIRQMRYSDEIKLFWRIGSKLFHGRFLRFMSGQKSTAEFLSDHRTPFNFAVPSKHVLQTNQVFQSSDIKPGLLPNILDTYAETECSKTFKLCVDGKKLNISSKSEKGGVDLFGYEDKPTAAERLERLTNENAVIGEIDKILNNFVAHDVMDLQSSIRKYPNECTELSDYMKKSITLLSLRISDLRQMKVKKSLTLKKLKDISGSNWRNSRYSFAISAIHTSLYQIEETIEECIHVIDDLGLACAIIQRSNRHFIKGDVAYMQFQENHVCLSGIESILDDLQQLSPYVRQRTDNWHTLRNSAKVTGNTINKALGLESLKKQNEFIANRFYGVTAVEPTEEQSKRM